MNEPTTRDSAALAATFWERVLDEHEARAVDLFEDAPHEVLGGTLLLMEAVLERVEDPIGLLNDIRQQLVD